MAHTSIARHPWAGYLLGFALGGFFDGILLHQILQWHHLLLGIRAAPFDDIRTQILADGLFHALMYGIALAGLWSWWRSRVSIAQLPGLRLVADAMIGFGVWHLADAVISHWLLGIHRIRMDVPDPLPWDLLWVVMFGIAPLILGVYLRRRTTGFPPGSAHGAMMLLAAVTALLGPIAAVPSPDTRQVAVLVSRTDANRLLDGLVELNGRILWADRRGTLWIFELADGVPVRQLYRYGALITTRSPAVLGCLAWVR